MQQPIYPGKIADPAFRRERARKARATQDSPEHHLRRLVDFVRPTTLDEVEALARVSALVESRQRAGNSGAS